MWVVFVFIAYLVLALVLPVVWAVWPAWQRARRPRQLQCPAASVPVQITLDPWFAVRMRTFGSSEARVKSCSLWPAHADCRRECLEQIYPAV